MARNTKSSDVITMRRERVASLRARGLTVREIAQTLGTEFIVRNGQRVLNNSYLVNPQTGEPFNFATISRDLKKLREEAIERAQQSIDEHRARQLEEINEAKRSCWSKNDLKTWARLQELEIKLLGTAAPERLDHTIDGQIDHHISARELSDDELARIATGRG